MVEHDGLMRVFWPTDIRVSERPGVVVGWRNSTLDVFVVAILDDVDPRNVEIHLRSNTFFRSGPHSSSRIYELCGHSSMHVLGLSNATNHALVDSSWVCATTSASREPRITCAKASSVQLILYDRPRPKGMQYISLNPISLALGDKWYASDDGKGDGSEGEEERRERQHQEAKLKLVNKLKQHSIIIRSASARDKALEKVVHQVNWSWELEQTLQKNVGKLGPRPKRGLSVSERVVESTTAMRNYILMQLWIAFVIYIFPFIRKGFVMLLFLHRALAEMLLLVLEFRIKPGYAALKDVSATAQQIEIRLLQFCYWPMQYITLRQRKMDWASVNTSHPDYIRFYNSLWLVANDVIIGIAIGSYIIENADWVSAKVNDLLRVYTVDALQSSISWLMGWPAGLKLNGELASFLGALFLWVITYWSRLQEKLSDTTAALAPKSRFQFKRTAKHVDMGAPENDPRLLSGSFSRNQHQPTAAPGTPKLGDEADDELKELPSERDYNAELSRPSASAIRKPSFSAARTIGISHQTGLHIILPSSAAMATASGSLINLTGCIVDMSIPTSEGHAFPGLAMRDIKKSLIVAGRVAGPVHITGISDSILVLVAHQVRIHDCKNVDIYLHCTSHPIIEDCSGMRFAPLPACYMTESDKAAENQWDQVDDFKWLKAGHSPNWTTMSEAQILSDEIWTKVVPGRPGASVVETLAKVGISPR
ncbi:N-acetylglucosaminyl-phosphatidylinositol biosynthetic protein gpi1 [Beauveria bassiana]|nr:N-acetylglucosaminyl-phosphatidylinositol biosynthetic protein gpi1 [Beauveria bassiana]